MPEQINNPFCYEPHPLCLQAAKEVERYLSQKPEWAEELDGGKMLGVLVCRQNQATGFLAAYSGQIGGREDWPWFVPAVFDYLQPDGYFKQEEAAISAINHHIKEAEESDQKRLLEQKLHDLQIQASADIAAYKEKMAQSKAGRDALRNEADEATLIRESQFQKAELRRLKQRWRQQIADVKEQLLPIETAINRMKTERHQRSDTLQHWLFDQFVMLNAIGEQRSLSSIFADTPQHTPPAGAGECCAPKLLQYAFLHQLQPLAIGEFWHGQSPNMEVRRHGMFYPACRGKCKPILEWMMTGLNMSNHQPEVTKNNWQLNVVYADADIVVVDKPAGLLSVPGLTGEPSVETLLNTNHAAQVFMVHRLDQDTSGLMVAALQPEAYHNLQRQFLKHTVKKKYIALVDGIIHASDCGTISLPLRPDLTDRPRQLVDFEHGKEAVTTYEVMAVEGKRTRLALTPHTGRTHQLRVHCAHKEGLGCPIVGDRLYGSAGGRLCLHAAELTFHHPVTGQTMTFSSKVPF